MNGESMTLDAAYDSSLAYAVSSAPYSERRLTILCLIAAGFTNIEAADKLQISRHTVAQHIAEMLHAVGARSRAELVARAYCGGILSTGSWPPELRTCGARVPAMRGGS
jgi:DNA-binding NarL/FixJ family response regulator